MSGERRGFLRDLLGRLGRLVEDDAADARPTFVPPPHTPSASVSVPARRVRRPPGAIEEAAFLTACTRCGDCLKACPEGTLVQGWDGYPWADVERHPCVMCADVPCAAACTTGALVHGPVIAFGTARVGARLCLNFGRALEAAEVDGDVEPACERCVDWCPVPGAIALGQDALPVVDAARCTGCGACVAHCAAYPHAIAIQ